MFSINKRYAVLESKLYFNFVNSINSEQTRRQYEYSLTQFLRHYQIDLDYFLGLSQKEISDYIIDYLVNRKISKQYKIVIFSAIKHYCEINDIILNWKKLKKFIKSDKTANSINGKDKGYTHEEIKKILEFSDQRLKTAFLILASTGIRIGFDIPQMPDAPQEYASGLDKNLKKRSMSHGQDTRKRKE